ncbi:uncharacterized protein [Medicago truncatula]|nr:uncharacterized protein LOC25498722 [Medicago truncatula]
MMRSNGPASKSCGKKSSHQRLQNQKHIDHMLLKSTSTKPQKRKLDQYINDGEFTTSYEFTCKDKYGSENVKGQRRNPSPLTCSTLWDGKGIILQGTQEYGFLAQNELGKKIGIYTEDYSHLSDSNDSIKGSGYLTNHGSLNIHARDLMVGNSHSCSAKTSIEEKPKEEDMDLIHSLKNFLPSRGNHLPRPFIPIGPRFQAEVPKWEGTTNIKQYNNDDCVKWLGTQIWPMPSLSKTNAKEYWKR